MTAVDESRRDVLRRTLVELKALRAELATLRRRQAEPVVVVGVGCRFPGGVTELESFWDLLSSGGSGIVPVPEDRWDARRYFDPDPETAGKMCSSVGGFLADLREFDADLFGIAPREAAAVDPMHRLVLEVAWEALEHAGIAPDSLRGEQAGVFIGAGASDYARLGAAMDLVALDGYAATGVALNFVANRLSFTLGLEGPSLVVDTACSSSLVALHLAVQGLRSGDCDVALAGGVNVILSPEVSVALSRGRMLSPSGACRTFDASADGYVRGEGCGIVVLRRLSDALVKGDAILGVVLGSAVNQDGRSSGITVPNAAAQRRVVRAALAAGDVRPHEVGYVEAHGTGTPLGDPIEVRALADVYGQGRLNALALGSVKTNLGHLEAAAGIAGFLKALMIVNRGMIPPHLNLTDPNPHIAWDELPVTVPTELTSWPDERRIAGVSAFGFGGTNAHLIVANPPLPGPRPAEQPRLLPAVVKVSGRGLGGLRAAAARLADFAAAHEQLTPHDLAWTAGVGRADLTERAAIVAMTRDELITGLRSIVAGSHVPTGQSPRVIFEIPAGGTADASVLDRIYDRVDTVTEVVDLLGGLDCLTPYGVAIALGTWWRAAGVEPDAIIGHGDGAFAAAALAGVYPVAVGAALASGEPAEVQPQEPSVELHCDGIGLPEWLARHAGAAVAGVRVILSPEAASDLMPTAARIWCDGIKLNWRAILPRPAEPPRLPPYPFQRTAHWIPDQPRTANAALLCPAPLMLGSGTLVANTTLSLARLPFLDEHRVHGRILVPGVVLLELVLSAAEGLLGVQPSISSLAISGPLVLGEDKNRDVQVVLVPDGADRYEAAVYSSSGNDEWAPHLTAKVGARRVQVPGAAPRLPELTRTLTGTQFYEQLWHPSFALGPSFRLLESADVGEGAAVGIVTAPASGCRGVLDGVRPELLLLDACVQLAAGAAGRSGSSQVLLGTGYERLVMLGDQMPEKVRCSAITRRQAGGGLIGDLYITDETEAPIAELTGVSFRPVAATTLERLCGADAPDRGVDLMRLRSAAPADRHRMILDCVVRLIADVLGANPDSIDPRENVSANLDSLMLVEVKTRIERDLGVGIPLDDFFDDGRPIAIANVIDEAIGKRTPARRLIPLTVAQMAERAVLDPSIAASCPYTPGPDDVLLTGATGFVGAFLLADLLEHRDSSVRCLVRAENEAHALSRVLANAASYGLDLIAHRDRIIPILGDLTRPAFGLDERAFTGLHDRVGHIYHCGALVKWTYPYSGLEAANVGGTREILRLATHGAVRPVHYISTVGVFSSVEYPADVVRETDDLLSSGSLVVGYAQSKWVAEHMARTASERGVPVTIHRVNTGGHSTTGAFNRLDHLSMMVKGCVEAGIAPCHAEMAIQPAPVDYVVRAIVRVSDRPELYGKTFHLVNDRSMSWTEFFDAIEGYGYPMERLSFSDWRARITSRGSGTMALLGLVPFLNDAADHVRLPLSDSTMTRACLEGLACPPLDTALVHTYLKAFIHRGFIDPPVA